MPKPSVTLPVHWKVNNVRNNGPELLEPVDPQPEQARLL